jgi:hypothetical protein
MTDAYVYSFMTRDEVADETTVSARLATLEAIKGRGEPVMESQTVVDHTELDNNGFVMSGIGDNSYAANDITAQIRSIELRAASRDREALTLDEGTQGKDKYMLSMESRELRGQAKKLKKQRAELLEDEDRSRDDRCTLNLPGCPTPE